MTTEELKDIINAGANALTKEQRTAVYAEADALGIAYEKKACKSCVIDLAIECVKLMQTPTGEGMRLKEGVDILVNGIRINEATCATAEEIDFALSIGTPLHYFDGGK